MLKNEFIVVKLCGCGLIVEGLNFTIVISLAAQPLAKTGGSGNIAILKLFCRNAINKLCWWWETL